MIDNNNNSKIRVQPWYVLFIRLHLFGLSKPIEICHITGCGVRPIVTCTPIALHWGQVKLLTKSQKILTLCNDSPVQVNFKATLVRYYLSFYQDYLKR